MKEPTHILRAAIISALNGNVLIDGTALGVYNQPPFNATYPYILVSTIQNLDESVKDSFISDIIVRVEVMTRFTSDNGGELDCNLAIDKILTLLIRNDLSVSGSFDTTNLSAVITSTDLSGITAGMTIEGTGIPAGTTVQSIDSATQITMSQAATATQIGVTLDFNLADFKVVTAKKDNLTYLRDIESKYTYFRGILEMVYKIEEI